jgi:hypothetical protein
VGEVAQLPAGSEREIEVVLDDLAREGRTLTDIEADEVAAVVRASRG